MPDFICPHCGWRLTEQARAALKVHGQLFTLALVCACGQRVVFKLEYTIVLSKAEVDKASR